MRIRILSDLHLEFLDWAPPPGEADVVVLDGDIGVDVSGLHWARHHFPETPVIYVPGNGPTVVVLGVGLLSVELFAIDAQFHLVFVGAAAALVGLLGLLGLSGVVLPAWGQWAAFGSSDGIFRAAQRGESRIEWARERRTNQATESGRAMRSAGFGRIAETAEAVQHDWLTTGTALERQGFTGLAAEVERFRQSLRIPRTRHEVAVAILVRAHAERVPVQLEFVK